MAKTYEITAPDGRVFEVTPPEGTDPTPEEVLERVRAHVEAEVARPARPAPPPMDPSRPAVGYTVEGDPIYGPTDPRGLVEMAPREPGLYGWLDAVARGVASGALPHARGMYPAAREGVKAVAPPTPPPAPPAAPPVRRPQLALPPAPEGAATVTGPARRFAAGPGRLMPTDKPTSPLDIWKHEPGPVSEILPPPPGQRLVGKPLSQVPESLGAPAPETAPFGRVAGKPVKTLEEYLATPPAKPPRPTKAEAKAARLAREAEAALEPRPPETMPKPRPGAKPSAAEAVKTTPVTTTRLGDFWDESWGGKAIGTVLGRLERLGMPGRAVGGMLQHTEVATKAFEGSMFRPVVEALRRLKPAEQANFVATLEAGAQPMNARVAAARAIYDPVFGTQGAIIREAQKRGLNVQPRPDFFPHEFSPQAVKELLAEGHGRHRGAVAHLLRTGQASSEAEAKSMLRHFLRPGKIGVERRAGGLEYHRELDLPGYITNPADAVMLRGSKIARRFAEVDVLGRGDERVKALVSGLENAGDMDTAAKIQSLFEMGVGHDPIQRGITEALRTLTTITALPLSFIQNATQTAQLAVRTNLITAAKGAFGGIPNREYARQLGYLGDQMRREMYERLTGRVVMGEVSKFALGAFNFVEEMNRSIAAVGGRHWANRLERILATATPGSRQHRWLQREFTRLGFLPEEQAAMFSSRQPMANWTDRIAATILEQTQFPMSKIRQTEFMKSDFGKTALQFKSFAINAGKLLKDTVWTELKNGNPGPMLRMLAVFPIVGELAVDWRVIARGGERQYGITDPRRWLVENVNAVGGLGLALDFVDAAARGPERVLSWLAGPVISEVTKGMEAGRRLVAAPGPESRTREALRAATWILRKVPYVGPPMASRLDPTETAIERRQLTHRESLGLDPQHERKREIRERRREIEAERRARRLLGR